MTFSHGVPERGSNTSNETWKSAIVVLTSLEGAVFMDLPQGAQRSHIMHNAETRRHAKTALSVCSRRRRHSVGRVADAAARVEHRARLPVADPSPDRRGQARRRRVLVARWR